MVSGSKLYFAASDEAAEHGATAANSPLTAQAADKLAEYLMNPGPAGDAAHEFIDILMRAEHSGVGDQIKAQIIDWGTAVCERLAGL